MQEQVFICEEALIDERLGKLKFAGFRDDVEDYLDPETGTSWELTLYTSEVLQKNIRLLQAMPRPGTADLINIALSSDSEDTVSGASMELCFREQGNNEQYREELLAGLERCAANGELSDKDKRRIQLVIFDAGLFSSANIRPVVGKHYTEIYADAAFFKDIAERSKKLLELLE